MSFIIPSRYDLYAGGASRVASSTNVLECISPISGARLTQVPDANAADVDMAVGYAAQAFPGWADMPAKKRQQLLNAVADRLVVDAKRIAWLETANTGKPMRDARPRNRHPVSQSHRRVADSDDTLLKPANQ